MTITADQKTSEVRIADEGMAAIAPVGIAYDSWNPVAAKNNNIPVRNWSFGDAPKNWEKNPSDVSWQSWLTLCHANGFNQSLANDMDANGVTANQFYEAFDSLGTLAFDLGKLIPKFDADRSILKAALADKTATMDLRYTYYLLSNTLRAPLLEVVLYARGSGYNKFFEYAGMGMTLEQIKAVEEGEIDGALLASLIEGLS